MAEFKARLEEHNTKINQFRREVITGTRIEDSQMTISLPKPDEDDGPDQEGGGDNGADPELPTEQPDGDPINTTPDRAADEDPDRDIGGQPDEDGPELDDDGTPKKSAAGDQGFYDGPDTEVPDLPPGQRVVPETGEIIGPDSDSVSAG